MDSRLAPFGARRNDSSEFDAGGPAASPPAARAGTVQFQWKLNMLQLFFHDRIFGRKTGFHP